MNRLFVYQAHTSTKANRSRLLLDNESGRQTKGDFTSLMASQCPFLNARHTTLIQLSDITRHVAYQKEMDLLKNKLSRTVSLYGYDEIVTTILPSKLYSLIPNTSTFFRRKPSCLKIYRDYPCCSRYRAWMNVTRPEKTNEPSSLTLEAHSQTQSFYSLKNATSPDHFFPSRHGGSAR